VRACVCMRVCVCGGGGGDGFAWRCACAIGPRMIRHGQTATASAAAATPRPPVEHRTLHLALRPGGRPAVGSNLPWPGPLRPFTPPSPRTHGGCTRSMPSCNAVHCVSLRCGKRRMTTHCAKCVAIASATPCCSPASISRRVRRARSSCGSARCVGRCG
jgi:hypothetical protein